MASKGKKTPRDLAIESLMKRSRERPHSIDLSGLILHAHDTLVLGDENFPDAALILILTSSIEQVLERAISTHFVLDEDGCNRIFDDNGNGPLSGFAAKIKIGFALGIYSKMLRDELDMMRHVRNLVAHAKEPVDFQHPSVSEACNHLIIPNRMRLVEGITKTAKRRFVDSARMAFAYLDDDRAQQPMKAETHPGRSAFSD